MKAWHYEAYTTRDGGIICIGCTGELTEDQETKLGYMPIFADSEADCYPVCDVCNQLFDYIGLTDEGIKYETANGNYK